MLQNCYECHITVETKRPNKLELFSNSTSWKHSWIQGDPDFGKGTRFFFTKHYTVLKDAVKGTNELELLLKAAGFKCKRKKIEKILFDTKLGCW